MYGLSNRRKVIVVGGGVIGSATAYQLSRAGFEVTLIERDGIAAHASGYNAGNLSPLHGTPAWLVPFALAAFQRHDEIAVELADLGCSRFVALPSKRIYVGFDDADRQELRAIAALFQQHAGFESRWLDEDKIRLIDDRLSSKINFGILIQGNKTVDSGNLTRSLAAGASALGATILEEAVTGVATASGRSTHVQTSQRLVACDELVLATGPWVAETRSWLGIDVPVEPVKGELLLLRMPGEAPHYDFTWGPASLYRRRENEVWVGGTTMRCAFDSAPTEEARELLLEQAERIMPCIRNAELLHHVAALRAVTVSNTPIAARANGWKNVYVANGGGWKGVLLSAGIALEIQDLLLGRGGKLSGLHQSQAF
jgi:glycine oxidase